MALQTLTSDTPRLTPLRQFAVVQTVTLCGYLRPSPHVLHSQRPGIHIRRTAAFGNRIGVGNQPAELGR